MGKKLFVVMTEKKEPDVTRITVLPNNDILIHTRDLDGVGIYVLSGVDLEILHSASIQNVDCAGITLYPGFIGNIKIDEKRLQYTLSRNDRYDENRVYELRVKDKTSTIYDPYWNQDFTTFKASEQPALVFESALKWRMNSSEILIEKLQPNIVILYNNNVLKLIDITEFRKTFTHQIAAKEAQEKTLELKTIHSEKSLLLSKISMFNEKIQDSKKQLQYLEEKENTINKDFYKINL